MADFNKNFSWNQMVTNTKYNKTSATGVIGVVFCFTGLLLFITTTICYFFAVGDATFMMSLLDKILILIGSGTCLLGVRKVGGMVANKENNSDNKDESNQYVQH